MNSIPGFASAQRAWENMEPSDSGCDCPQLFQCKRCDGLTITPGPFNSCPDRACIADAGGDEDASLPQVHPIDREDNEFEAVSSCPQHGFCTGCTSRHCEDCGGDYDRDED